MNRYNLRTWVFKCIKCGAGSAEGDFGPAYDAYKPICDGYRVLSDDITGLCCKPCRNKIKEKK